MIRRKLTTAALACVLGASHAVAAQTPVVEAACQASGKHAAILMTNEGNASAAVGEGEAAYRCGLTLVGVSGPPFTDNATGMLLLEFRRGACDPAAAKRKVQRTVDLHITDHTQASNEAMAVIERRTGVFKCAIRTLDMPGLSKLAQPLVGKNGAD